MERRNFLMKTNINKKTVLDKAYNKHINTVIDSLDEEKEARWETYNVVIQELVGEGDYFDEIKYRLTDGEDPNNVILDIVNRNIQDANSLTWILKKRIEDYLEEDYIKRFYL